MTTNWLNHGQIGKEKKKKKIGKTTLHKRKEKHTSPSDPRIVTRYTTVTLPLSENITSRISPHQPAKKDVNI